MTRKYVFLTVFVFLCVGTTVFFLFYHTEKTREKVSYLPGTAEQEPTGTPGLGIDRTTLHPLASAEARAAYEKRPVASWEEWQKARAELNLGEYIQNVKVENLKNIDIAALRQEMYEYNAKVVAHQKKAGRLPPKNAGSLRPAKSKYYQGIQTPEALITEFDAKYSPAWHTTFDLDAHYPKEEWLQRLLDKGAIVKDSGDYRYYLDLRAPLLEKKEKPEEWRSGKYGIPITTDFAEYEDGYLDRKVWENSIIQKVSAAHPETSLTTVYFPANHPDKYLPVIGKMTYVRLNEDRSSIRTSGVLLTKEQNYNLRHHGIEPEDIEIVYIDDAYNVLPEPPLLLETQIFNTLTEFDGIKITPENYESVVGRRMPDKWLENYEEGQTREMQDTTLSPDIDAIRTAAGQAVQAEQEKFQQGLRELEKFVNMSDAEIEAELEQRFTPQIPELPTADGIENRLWSEIQSSVMTPARFKAALKILEAYGPEEGMRKLIQADPKAATQVKRILGGASAPEQLTEPPTHPEQQERTAPPEPNAP